MKRSIFAIVMVAILTSCSGPQSEQVRADGDRPFGDSTQAAPADQASDSQPRPTEPASESDREISQSLAAALQARPINGNIAALELDYDQTLRMAETLVDGLIVRVSDLDVRAYNSRTIACGESEEHSSDSETAVGHVPDPGAQCDIASQLAVLSIDVRDSTTGEVEIIEVPLGFMTGSARYDDQVHESADAITAALSNGIRLVALTSSVNDLGSLATNGSLALLDRNGDTLHFVAFSDDFPVQGIAAQESLEQLKRDFAASRGE